MTLVVRAVFSVMAYLGVVIAPLVFAAMGGSQPALGFWTNFSVALGFVGLAMMGLEFALVARFQPVAAPFGQDGLLQFHREIGYVGLGFILLHVALSAHWRELWAKLTFSPDTVATPALVILGSLAVLAVIVLVVTSEWRVKFRLSYEWWHAIHMLLAVVAVVGALAHVYLVDGYVNTPWKRALWGLMSAAFLGLLGWVRLAKPRAMSKRPWRLERLVAERGQTTTLVLKPPDGVDFRFEPGQFAWFALGRSPFSLSLHPFSFSSSAERQEVEIAVKALGDFTSKVRELSPGTTVYVDGPHGVFSMDRDEGPGFGFIAGGVGITGLLSMLRTIADRKDVRPAVLVYANNDWEGVAFREELERIQTQANLTVVHVLTRPPADWPGESGFVRVDLLARHLPPGYRRFQFFICGPAPMMDAAEKALVELGVPDARIHTERFDMV